MTARLLDKSWALPLAMAVGAVAAAVAVVGAVVAAQYIFFLPTPAADPETRTVVKVCRSGALVLREQDGSFRVLRPNAWGTWPAFGPGVCE